MWATLFVSMCFYGLYKLSLCGGLFLAPLTECIDVFPFEVGGGFVAPVQVVGLFGGVGVSVGGIEEGVAGVALEFFESFDESL